MDLGLIPIGTSTEQSPGLIAIDDNAFTTPLTTRHIERLFQTFGDSARCVTAGTRANLFD